MSDEPRDPFTDQLPAYALGALDRDELSAVEAHLAQGCPGCEGELAAWSGLVERMEGPAAPVVPSAAVRARVLAAVAGEPRGAREPRRTPAAPRSLRPAVSSRWPLRLAAAASIAAVLLAGWAAFRIGLVRGEVRAELARAAAERARLAGGLAETRGEIARVAASLEIAGSPATRAILLAGLPPAPGAAGTTLVDPRTRSALFYAHHLPDPGADKTYQLWYITDRGPISAGVFDVDVRGDGSLRVEGVADPAAVVAWAVTVEPAGGVPQPTGEMVLKG
jgi:anti-sigma-K factor RskA